MLSVFGSSQHEFIVKDINVQTMTTTAAPSTYSPGGGMPGGGMIGGGMPGNQLSPYTPLGQSAYQPPSAPVSRGGLQTVLNEQVLGITLKIEVVKLLPGI